MENQNSVTYAEAGEQTFRVGRIVAGGGEVQYANEGGLFA